MADEDPSVPESADVDFAAVVVMVERRWVSATHRRWGIRDGNTFKHVGTLGDTLAAVADRFVDPHGGEIHILPDTTDEERG